MLVIKWGFDSRNSACFCVRKVFPVNVSWVAPRGNIIVSHSFNLCARETFRETMFPRLRGSLFLF